MEDSIDFRIIVIDDNPEIHHDFIKILSSTDVIALDDISRKMFGKTTNSKSALLPKFHIDTASQGKEGVMAIKKAIEEGNAYSLAFVDIRMPPGWDGIETIQHIWELDKDIQIVICTAFSDYSWEETVEKLGKTDNLLILKKPFDNVSVRQLACALTKKWQLLQDTLKFTDSLKEKINEKTTSLKKSLSLVKATLESSDEGIVVISLDEKIIDYNQKLLHMWDIPEELMEQGDTQTLFEHIESMIKNAEEFFLWLESLKKVTTLARINSINLLNGKIYDCYSQPQKLDKEVIGRVLNFRDITKRKKLENQLHYQATHDALTRLPNRVLLLEKFHYSLKRAQEEDNILAAIFIDLDRFKLINDSLSHAAGDKLLFEVATRLQNCFREDDVVARIGGDEFVVLLPKVKTKDVVIEKAKEILLTFQKPVELEGRNILATASIGISIYPKDGSTTDVLLRNADAAMYYAKEMGSNNYQFYEKEMDRLTLEKLDRETQLREALKNNEFLLYYQPQFDLNDEKIIAAEALLRWQHPTLGLLLPMDFIPLAEETGLIVPIGEWVIRTACEQNKAWQTQGLPPVRVAVNITSQQLKQPRIVELVKEILSETKLAPEYLELELTENVIISSLEVIRVVTELKALGVRIAIDDFGTGYSSLSYLKKLPLDRLKIDSSFIQHIQSANDDEVIIRAIISLAKHLNLEVLVEGVETQTQLNFLKQQNCVEIQGFYYSKPLPEKEFEKLIHQTINKGKVDLLQTEEIK